MHLRRLQVRNWRAVGGAELEFAPGLNFVCGPNESGKSSLREALRMAFLCPNGGTSLESVRPWGNPGACPEVTVVFVHAGQAWTLRRVFFGSGSELHRGNQLIAREDDIPAALERELSDFSILWSVQGETELGHVPDNLRPQLAAAEVVSPGVTWLESEITNVPELPSPADLLRRARQKEERAAELRHRLHELDGQVAEIESLEAELERVEAAEREAQQAVEQGRARLLAWEAYWRGEAEVRAVEQEVGQRMQWLERWRQNVERQAQVEREVARYRERLERFQAEVGPEPDRAVVRELQARLEYGRGLEQRKLRTQLEDLRPPGREGLIKLERAVNTAEIGERALARLEEAARAAEDLRELQEAWLAARQAEEEQAAAVARSQLAYQEHRRMAAVELENRIQKAENALYRWSELRAQLVETSTRVEAYRRTVRELEAVPPPDRSELEALEARMAALRSREQELLREELEELRAPDHEDLVELEQLERTQRVLEGFMRELSEVEQLHAQLGPVRQQVAQLERATESLRTVVDNELHVAESSKQRREVLNRQLEQLERGRISWRRLETPVLEQTARLKDYHERLSQLRAATGPEPTRARIDELQARQDYMRVRLQQLGHEELQKLDAPSQQELARLEAMAVAPVVEGGEGIGLPKLISGLILFMVFGFVGGMMGGLQPLYSAGAAGMAGLASALVALAWGWIPRKRAVKPEDRLAEELGDTTLDELRAKAARAARLELMGAADPPDPVELETRRLAVPDPDAVDAMTSDELKRELDQLPKILLTAETEWRDAVAKHREMRREYEDLLQDNPERMLLLFFEPMRREAETFPELALDVPDELDRAWLAQLSAGHMLAQFDRRLEAMREELRQLPPETEPTSAELYRKSQEELEQARAQLRDLTARAQVRRDMLDQRLQASGLNVSAHTLEAEYAVVQTQLQALLESLQVGSVREAEQQVQRARALENRLEASGASSGLTLSEAEVQAELRALPARMAELEAAWQRAQLAYQAAQRELEAVRGRSPEAEHEAMTARLREAFPEMGEVSEDWGDRLRRDLAELQGQRVSEMGPPPDPAEEARLKDLQQATAAAREQLQKKLGMFEVRRDEFNRLVGSQACLLQLGELPDVDRLPDWLGRTRACVEGMRRDLAAVLEELGVESLEDARERENRAREVRALVEDETLSDERLEQLRQQLGGAESLEAADLLSKLRRELRSVADRLQEAEEEWQQAHRAWSERRQAYEALLRENPENLIPEILKQRAELAAEIGLEEEDVAGVQRALEARIGALSHQKAAQFPPDTDEQRSRERLAEAERVLRESREEVEGVQAQIQRRMGALRSQSELYSELVRAEEDMRRAQAEHREISLELESRELLALSLEAARQDLENDLVGPLRQRIGERLEQMTSGRYRSIGLDQEFGARSLVTAGREQAPLGELSYGTREMVIFLSRVCLAELLSEGERHMMMFDDSLVHTDTERLEAACRILLEVSRKAQIVLMTCHPERYEPILSQGRVHEVGKVVQRTP